MAMLCDCDNWHNVWYLQYEWGETQGGNPKLHILLHRVRFFHNPLHNSPLWLFLRVYVVHLTTVKGYMACTTESEVQCFATRLYNNANFSMMPSRNNRVYFTCALNNSDMALIINNLDATFLREGVRRNRLALTLFRYSPIVWAGPFTHLHICEWCRQIESVEQLALQCKAWIVVHSL